MEFIVVIAIIAIGIVAIIKKDEQKVRQEEEKKAQEQAEKARKEREYEQESCRQIREVASKIPESAFYRELLSSLKEQIGKDVKLYFAWAYGEYMKTPGARPENFRTYLAKAHNKYVKEYRAEPGKFRPFPDHEGLILASAVFAVTPDGVYAKPHDKNYRVSFEMLQYCEFQFSCEKHGYASLSQIQVYALAQTLSMDLGYKMACFRKSYNWLDRDDFWTCKESAYRKKIEEDPNQKFYIDLEPAGETGYLAQVIESEIRKLQASSISYRSPF